MKASKALIKRLDPLNRNRFEDQLSNWTPPSPTAFVVMNVDASVCDCGSVVGWGGVARDHHGAILFGFSKKLDRCSLMEGKAWVICHGVCLAWGRGMRKLITHSDSQNALDLINDASAFHHSRRRAHTHTRTLEVFLMMKLILDGP